MNVMVGGVPVVGSVVVRRTSPLPAVFSVNTTVTLRGFRVMTPSASVLPVGDVLVIVAGTLLRPVPSFEATIVQRCRSRPRS